MLFPVQVPLHRALFHRRVFGSVHLRDDYFLIDFDRDPQRVDVGGIGGRVRCVPRQFDLSFRTETGEPFELRTPILIPELVDAPAGGRRGTRRAYSGATCSAAAR